METSIFNPKSLVVLTLGCIMMMGSGVATAVEELKPIKAIASGVERIDLSADKAIDKNIGTRWSSAFNDQQWIYFDLGATASISRVRIIWEQAYASDYQLQTSNDAKTWTTIKSVTGGKGSTEDMMVSGSGRYLRMNGIKRASQYGYSMYEIAMWGTSSTNAATTPSTTTPQPTTSPPTSTTTPSVAAVELKPIKAVATTYENAGLNATNAIDKNLATRWSSAFLDPQWLYLDFGATAKFSRVKINWDTAYGTDYQLQTSNDARNWTIIKSVVGGKGGVEDMVVSGSGRYLRLYGTKRSSPYGYSLYEIAAWGNLISSPTPAPAPTTSTATPGVVTVNIAGSNVTYLPLFANNTPVTEQIQYSEPDGTLVTLAGFRPTNRHAREIGEPWGSPDTGPGNYFSFPTWYFQNRTFGLMIRDGIPAGRSIIEISMIVNDGTFIGSAVSAFRRLDANVGAYGWMMNVGLENPKEGGKTICRSTSAPEDCMVVITNNWRAPQPNTLLKAGDLIELSPAAFLDHIPGGDKALIDGGGIRYYSFEQLYVVGKGMRPWYGVAPTLDSHPLPDSALLGGQASVSYNYSEEPMRVFQQMVNNIGIANTKRFVEGRRLFHTSFADGKHSESPDVNPVFKEHINQLGPRFNNVRCIACHAQNGRSLVSTLGNRLDTMAIFTAASSTTASLIPHPTYGLNIQQQALTAGAPDYSVSVSSYEKTLYKLPSGETVELQKPVYGFKGPVPTQFSVRQAPQVIGMGLLEAVDESSILKLADPYDNNGDGVKGVPNWVINPENSKRQLGRFGWKAGKASIRQQAAVALMQDMGVTSPVFPTRACQQDTTTTACKTTQTIPGVNEKELQRLTQYLQLVGVPAQRNLRSGYVSGLRVPPEHDVNPTRIANGAMLFKQANCIACHTAQMTTGNTHPFAELRNQVIHPYTDLLLHDMGAGLADTLTEGNAQPKMWRTAPLWGIGSLPYVQKSLAEINGPNIVPGAVSRARYLHDGRARTLTEAILWHDGEAKNSRVIFERLSKTERDDVLTFLNSL
ncbi:MAG: di-heme oxidoredictase family protein [Pseudomonadota bacterium]